MRKFMQAIRQVIEECNATVIIIHHTGKKKNENDLYTGRGSSVLADDAEVTAAFSKDSGNKGRFTLSVHREKLRGIFSAPNEAGGQVFSLLRSR